MDYLPDPVPKVNQNVSNAALSGENEKHTDATVTATGEIAKNGSNAQCSEGSLSPLGQAALRYASEFGFAVFPCSPGTKLPATRRGFHDATTDPRQIIEWWTAIPDANIGWCPGMSEHSVVDLDRKPPKPEELDSDGKVIRPAQPAKDGLAALAEIERKVGQTLPTAPTILTPGDGEHRIFEGALPSSSDRIAPGIDIRGGVYTELQPIRDPKSGISTWTQRLVSGGYGLLPPSVLDDREKSGSRGAYRWGNKAAIPKLPQWFADIIPPARTVEPRKALEGVEYDTDDAIQRSIARIEQYKEKHGIDGTYKLAAWLLDLPLSTAKVVELLDEHWPHPNGHDWNVEKVEHAEKYRQNDHGCDGDKRATALLGGAIATVLDSASPQQSGVVYTVPASQDDLAIAFAACQRDQLRYVDDWNRWMGFDGRRWIKVPVPTVWNLIKPHARDCAMRMQTKGTSDSTRRNLLSRQTIAGVEALARGNLIAPVGIWDANPWWLNTPAGIVDLHTGELGPALAEAYCTKMTAVAPRGDCPRWRRFLAEVTNGDAGLQQYLQRLVGYSLVGEVSEHVLAFLYGTGGNGKGVFLNSVAGILADYAKVAPIDTFTETKSDRHPTDMAMLQGARLVTAQETDEDRAWAEARIKALTGGDPVTARFMHQDFFTYTPQFKLLIAGNHKPRLRNVDEAMRRRLHLIPFTVTIPAEQRDPDLPEKLREEWPGILAWAIEGCTLWQKIGLAPPSAVLDMTASYFTAQDPLSAWIEECCIKDAAAFATTADLYQSYETHTRTAGEWPEPKERFSIRLESHGFTPHRGNARGFRGIRLRPNTGSML